MKKHIQFCFRTLRGLPRIILRGKNGAGFTMVEILVVSSILLTVGVVIVQLFLATMKGGVKSVIMATIKENGDFAETVMVRMIQNATAVTICSTPGSTNLIKITNPDKNETTFQCTDGRIASISAVPLKTYYLTSTGVTVSNCSVLFNCQLTENKININFTLTQNKPEGAKIEDAASMNFNTTVAVRNY